MKNKTLMMIAALVIVGLVAGAAWAGQWGGPRGGNNRGYAMNAGPGGFGGYCAMSEAFVQDTLDLRKQMAGKRGEYHALMAGQNPDPGKLSQLKQEMFEIREQLRAKAREHNLPVNAGMGGENRGPGGKNARQAGPCWR
ncbi:MAG: periplasmic heavy metal sensor [Desulfosalsimonas sp.]